MPTTNLTLHVEPGTDALHRVICICHRRRVEVVALSYEDRQITLTISGSERQLRQIGSWLAAPVNVFGVNCDQLSGLRMAMSGP